MGREARVQAAFHKGLRKRRILYAKMSTQGYHGVSGYPDTLVPLPGNRVAWFEAKAPGEPLRPRRGRQETVIEDLRKLGQVVVLYNDPAEALRTVEMLL